MTEKAKKPRKTKLKSGTVDAFAQKKQAEEKAKQKATKEGKVPYAQYLSEIAKAEGVKIADEHTTKVHPLIIDFMGKKTPVVDPTGIWSMTTPPYMRSQANLVLHSIAKPSARFHAVFDMETFQFRAGVLHHAAAQDFEDDQRNHDREDFPGIRVMKTWEDVIEYIKFKGVQLINDCVSNPGNGSKTSKIYAHNGARFDWVGLALHLGIDRHTNCFFEVLAKNDNPSEGESPDDLKKYKFTARISSHSGKSRITIEGGVGGKYKVILLDSYYLIPTKLGNLGDSLAKGVTPIQFTDPVRWINEKIRPSTITEIAEGEEPDESGRYAYGYIRIPGTNTKAQRFDVKLSGLRPYLTRAHKHTLSDFDPQTGDKNLAKLLSAECYEALTVWHSTIDDIEYTYSDIVVLINAIKRYAKKFRTIAEPLRGLLGDDVVDSLNPLSYGTISTAGFALSVAYWYEARLERTEKGIELKKFVGAQQKVVKYALVDGSTEYVRMIDGTELQDEIMSGTPILLHGIVKKGQKAIVKYPVWTTAFDNRWSRLAQNGSQTTAFQTVAEKVVEFDINSSFPNSMANGNRRKVRFDGYSSEQVDMPSARKLIPCNALIGFEDPGYRSHMPTKSMYALGLVTTERMKNEHGQDVDMLVVRGRSKILHMLQIRNGDFMCQLVPSANPELSELPVVPFRTNGSGLDSRLINGKIVEPTLAMIRGSYLAAYAAYPTVDDESMVVFLAEKLVEEEVPAPAEGEDETTARKPRVDWRPRSRHGPIMGVSVSKDLKVFGAPFRPHQKFFDVLFNTRLSEKRAAAEAKSRGDLKAVARFLADAEMTKLIMNGGGYGTYAQNKRPEDEFCIESIDECEDRINTLIGLDPSWKGMSEAIKSLTPDLAFEDDECSWSTLKASLEIHRANHEALVESGNVHATKLSSQTFIRSMRTLFTEWADNHITSFTVVQYSPQEVDENGNKVTLQMGILTAAEETSSHAIRCYASEVVAKSAITLHDGQLAAHRSPFYLAYSDTDSLHIETGRIKDFNDAQIEAIIRHYYAKHHGDLPVAGNGRVDYSAALLTMMHVLPQVYNNRPIIAEIMEVCGLSIGSGLGQWGLETTRYSKGLVMPIVEDTVYASAKTYYLAPKVYIDTDSQGIVARAKVRSVPKNDPIQPAVFQGHVVGIPSLADRRGLSHETLRYVRLDGRRKIKAGKSAEFVGARKEMSNEVNSMFSNPRRIYKDTKSSEAFSITLPEKIKERILAGEKFSPSQIGAAVMSGFGVGAEKENIVGLEDAYLEYQTKASIRGMSFSAALDKVEKNTAAVRTMISKIIETNADDDLNADVIAMPEDGDYNELMKQAMSAYEATSQAYEQEHGKPYPEDFIPFPE